LQKAVLAEIHFSAIGITMVLSVILHPTHRPTLSRHQGLSSSTLHLRLLIVLLRQPRRRDLRQLLELLLSIVEAAQVVGIR